MQFNDLTEKGGSMLDKIDAPSFNEEDLPELTDLYDAILTMKNPRELNMFFR
jgi:hypothetical protein